MKLEMRTFKNAFELQIVQARVNNNDVNDHDFCGQSYKHFTIVSYDSKAEFGQIFSQYDSREENYNHKVLYMIDHSTHTHTHSFDDESSFYLKICRYVAPGSGPHFI